MTSPRVRLGLIGHGTVGSAFAEQFFARQRELSHRAHARLELVHIAVRDPARHVGRVRAEFTDAPSVARDPSIDVVVEASGAAAAASWIRDVLDRGGVVVTANKQAVANDEVLLTALVRRHRRLRCEGAVAAAVPIVGALRDSLAGEEILGLRGVLNGTTTFVLSRMESGADFATALAEARAKGFAEVDPSDDLSGADAAAKLAILCTLAWRTPFNAGRVVVDALDQDRARAMVRAAPPGSRVRLVAQASRLNGRIAARVAPVILAPNDLLGASSGVVNVVEVRAALAGTLTWSGPGAGGAATASALLGDTVAAVRELARRRGRVAA